MITPDATTMLLIDILHGAATACVLTYLLLAARKSTAQGLLRTERITAHQLLTGDIDQATYRARMQQLALRDQAPSPPLHFL